MNRRDLFAGLVAAPFAWLFRPSKKNKPEIITIKDHQEALRIVVDYMQEQLPNCKFTKCAVCRYSNEFASMYKGLISYDELLSGEGRATKYFAFKVDDLSDYPTKDDLFAYADRAVVAIKQSMRLA